MTSTDARFAGSIPAIYEQYLVPLLFQPYADDIAARLADVREGTLLELAAGTGAVTRTLRKTLPAAVRIVATDLNDAMLAVNAQRLGDPSVTRQKVDAQQLPFADATADVIVCQFGVMFFPDRAASYREARRVLRAGGRYVFNVWDRLARNEVSDIVNRAVGKLFPENPPGFYERTPFGYHDVALIRRDLEGTGFARIEIETVEKVSLCTSAEETAIGLCQGTPLRSEIEARDASRLEEATAAAASALVSRFGRSPIENRMSAHVVTAWA